jgi:hypothetical protein
MGAELSAAARPCLFASRPGVFCFRRAISVPSAWPSADGTGARSVRSIAEGLYCRAPAPA